MAAPNLSFRCHSVLAEDSERLVVVCLLWKVRTHHYDVLDLMAVASASTNPWLSGKKMMRDKTSADPRLLSTVDKISIRWLVW